MIEFIINESSFDSMKYLLSSATRAQFDNLGLINLAKEGLVIRIEV